MTDPGYAKTKFSEELHIFLASRLKADNLVILDDFNFCVGTDLAVWRCVLDRHGIGGCTSNGLRLLRPCAEHRFLMTNTFFRLPMRKKATRMHPRSRRWHLQDYVPLRKQDRQDILVTKGICDVDD
ncbi:hypothetical protein SprV_0200937100 [Sparganum proliferum]